MPYWAQPAGLTLGAGCKLSGTDREAVQAAWAVADLPIQELSPMVSELLGSDSPVVRGAGLAVLGRAKSQAQDPNLISELLGKHHGSESVAALKELSSTLETVDAMVGLQRLDAVVLGICQ